MFHVFLHKGVADLTTRRMQSILVFVIVAAAAGVGALAVTITRSAGDTYDRVVEDAHGGHAWVFANNPDLLKGVAALPGVESASGPFARASGTLANSETPHLLILW